MKKYAKIINKETKECEVGLYTNDNFYRSLGMIEMDVEQAYDGHWYIEGYLPEKPKPTKEQILAIRDHYFEIYVDWYQSKPLLWEEMTAKEKQLISDYRIYLRDYDDRQLWWEQEPMTYDEWIERKN